LAIVFSVVQKAKDKKTTEKTMANIKGKQKRQWPI
jgi:hypothetical protein